MQDLEFARPVYVLHLGRAVEIDTIAEALTLLVQWPPTHRGALFQAALEACEAAVDGEVTPAEAREALAELAGISRVSAPAQMRGGARKMVASPNFSH